MAVGMDRREWHLKLGFDVILENSSWMCDLRERETLGLNPRLLAKVRRHGGGDMKWGSLVKSSVLVCV